MTKSDIEKSLNEVVNRLYRIKETIELSRPGDVSRGDFTTTVALKLAKNLKRKPLEIAEEVLKAFNLEGVEGEVAAPGFINFTQIPEIPKVDHDFGYFPAKEEKVQLEHTALNINKAMHVGHLRNTCIGDSLARILRAAGYPVEVLNKLDDTGEKAANALAGMKLIDSIKREAYQKFDHYAWDVYTQVAKKFKEDPDSIKLRDEMLQKLDQSDPEFMAWAQPILDEIEKGHVETMSRLNIYYDVFVSESVILKTKLWNQVRARLEETGNFIKETSGPNAGAWVIKDVVVDPKQKLTNPDKILMKSNGVTTYTGKDIALHMWKFGLVDTPWKYEDFLTQPNGLVIKRSVPRVAGEGAPLGKGGFGRANIVIDIVDDRQTYVMAVVGKALEKLGYSEQAKNYHHIPYAVVGLSADAAKEFNIDTSDGKKFYTMEGSKGIGVKIDDLIDKVIEKVKQKQKESGRNLTDKSAEQVAVGAIKFYILKYTLTQPIAFDFEDALNFEGDTGPYVQYTYARIQGILRKIQKSEFLNPKNVDPNHDEILLIRQLNRYPDAVALAAEKYEPNQIANYLLRLAQQFNSYYAKYPVLKAEENIRDFRCALIGAVAGVLKNGLDLLGIEAPEEM